MSHNPDEASLPGRPVWQRPDWRILERPLAPSEQVRARERQLGEYVSRREEMVIALDEAKQSGQACVLRCISPLKVPPV